MTEDRIQKPCLYEEGMVEKKIYNYRQWLKRFKQNTKKKHIIEIGPLIKEGTITKTENNLEEKMQQDFLWVLGPKATHRVTRFKYRTTTRKIETDKLIKLYNRYYLPKKKKKTHEEIDFF